MPEMPGEIAALGVDLGILFFIGLFLTVFAAGLWQIFRTRQNDLDNIDGALKHEIDSLAKALRREIKENRDSDKVSSDQLHRRINRVEEDLRDKERESKRDAVEYYKALIEAILRGKE